MTIIVAAIHKVVFIERKATALLSSLDIRIPIGSGGGDRFTRQYGEEVPRLRFEFASAPSGSEPLRAEEDLTADDGTDDHAIVGSNRGEP